jgi:hypothetical protein
MEPTPEQRERLARQFFGNGAHQHLTWKDLNEDEQRGLLDEFRQQQPSADELARAQEADRRMAAAGKGTPAQRIFDATKSYVERNIDALVKRLPQLLEKDLSAIVGKAIANEMGFVNQRQVILSAQAEDKLTRLSERLDKFKAYDGKAHCQALDAFTRELQGEIRELQREVAELKRR